MSFKYKNIFRVYRPSLILAPAIIFGLGLFFSQAKWSWFIILELFQLTFLAPLFVFGINDIFDYETDKNNPRKLNKFFGGILPIESHLKIFWLANIASLIMLFTSAATLNLLNFLAMLIGITLSWVYSAPPFRIKSKPFGDVLANIVGLFSILLLGVSFGSLDKFLDSVPLERIVGAGLALFMASLLAGLADYESDKKAEITTTTIWLGKNWSVVLGFIAILPLTLIRFNEAEFMSWAIWLILATYSTLFFNRSSGVISFIYATISVITILSFATYLLVLFF